MMSFRVVTILVTISTLSCGVNENRSEYLQSSTTSKSSFDETNALKLLDKPSIVVSPCVRNISNSNLCTSRISWKNAPNGSCIFVKGSSAGTTQTFACGGKEGFQDAPWLLFSNPSSLTFVLANSSRPSQIYAESTAPKIQLSASPCIRNTSNSALCTSRISWKNAPDGSCVFVKGSAAGTTQTFACGGKEGFQDAPWLSLSNPAALTFVLAKNSQLSEVFSETRSTTAIKVPRKSVLSIDDGKFYLDGERFAEISFNKFDLFWQLFDELSAGRNIDDEKNLKLIAQRKALSDLRANGFRTIRIFASPWDAHAPEVYSNPEKRKIMYSALDKTLELCRDARIRVVWSLGAATFTDTRWINGARVLGKEHIKELIADRDSRSRKLLYSYLDDIVSRYKDNESIAMWEISNEVTLTADIGIYNGERHPTLAEVALFFDDVAKRIKDIDPLRLVNSGGSAMREQQWSLFKTNQWKLDTRSEHLDAFKTAYSKSAVDIIDIHYYPQNNEGHFLSAKYLLNEKEYMKIAQEVGKPLMFGEFARLPVSKSDKAFWINAPNYFDNFNDKNAVGWTKKSLDAVVDAGVQLSYWWT